MEIGEILRKTFSTYKEGFGQFIGLSAISLFMVVCMAAFSVAIDYSSILAMLLFVLLIAALYFNIRMDVSIYKLARSLTLGTRMTLKESYRSSKGLAGTYFAVVLLYFFITVVPLVCVAVSYTFVQGLVLKWVLVVLFCIPFAFLYTRYYLAVASALLSERMNGEFQSSKRLVKGDFWRVLIIIILTYGLFLLMGQMISVWTQQWGVGLRPMILGALLDWLIVWFTTPIGIISAVHMYLDLNEIKKIDRLPGEINI